MKIRWLRIAGASIACSTLLLAGCAESNQEDAQYPQTPPPEQVHYSASLEANPPSPPTNDVTGTGAEGTSDPATSNGNPEIAIGVDNQNYSDTDPSALTEFKPTLDPHGTWTDDPNYGVVWQPSAAEVGSDFQPYVSAGHWAYDDDWVWVSDYSWGWAPFHYGRWVHLGGRGWAWVPGRVYRGAWVDWRVGYGDYDYIGWAPMGPSWYWHDGFAVGFYGGYYVPSYYYCGRHDVFAPVIATRVLPPARAAAIAGYTRPYAPVRAVATPTVGGRVVARPAYGPAPSSMGITATAVVHTTPNDPGVARARAFATPSTAVAAGAHPPQGFARPAVAAQPSVRGPQFGAVGGGPTRLPDHGATPGVPMPSYRTPSPAPSYRSTAPMPSYRPGVPMPTYRPAAPMPSYHAPPSFHAPTQMPSYHPAAPSMPSYHAPAAPAPSFHSSGGGGGGAHFGGGGGHVGGGGGGHGGHR